MTVPEIKHPAAGGDRQLPLDAAAFSDRFRESYRVLWLIAVGVLGDRHLAEDAVQEAAVIGLKKLKNFESGTNFTAWMGQIVRHVSSNIRRKKMRRQAQSLNQPNASELAERTGGAAADEITVGQVMVGLPEDQQHFDDRMLKALQSLGEVARACLLLRTLEGLAYEEISGLLGIPKGTAMSHVYRTRKSLRQMLSENSDMNTSAMGETS